MKIKTKLEQVSNGIMLSNWGNSAIVLFIPFTYSMVLKILGWVKLVRVIHLFEARSR
jgi:hypothetical protein